MTTPSPESAPVPSDASYESDPDLAAAAEFAANEGAADGEGYEAEFDAALIEEAEAPPVAAKPKRSHKPAAASKANSRAKGTAAKKAAPDTTEANAVGANRVVQGDLILPPESLAEQRYGEVSEAVRRTFGFESLRPLQDKAIRAALEGQDALVVLPTGAGKSLCFQAPAMVQPGLVVVLSPLIALMKDQVDGLLANGVPAAMLNSTQTTEERRDVYRDLEAGKLDLLYIAPERLAMEGFIDKLDAFGMVSMAVDEAHCISHWGHDFRPEYRQVGELRAKRPDLPIQAFTATATPEVQRDICKQLGLRDPQVLVGDFDRPNLTYRVKPRRTLADQAMEVIKRHEGEAGIIYCLSRKAVEKLADELHDRGVRCEAYHAGMTARRRNEVQDQFQSEQIDVVVATVAFGMGIDRTDVRYVIHGTLPKGIEQYSQETGRAGRDGLPAECVLFHSGSDYHNWKHLMERSAQEAVDRGMSQAQEELDASLARLGHTYGFATGARCRHAFLLEYFGQVPGEDLVKNGCGACDVCLGELEKVDDGLVLAQKILSCVVRCEQRYGAGHITDVLRGADTQRMRDSGHDKLPTHGLLKEHTVGAVRGWIEQLTGHALLAVTGGKYPTLYLTRTGVEVLKGERSVELFLSQTVKKEGRKRRKAAVADALDAGLTPDEGLFEDLREFRRELARERGVPPYLIFNDRTLALMAATKPTDTAALLELKGVGEKKAADLGPLFLERIAAYGD